MAKDTKHAETVVEPYIGSYVLETLTTGMYAESRNALREYIQNSFDAIRAAVRGKVIKQAEGRITVTMHEETRVAVGDNRKKNSTVIRLETITAIRNSNIDRQKDGQAE